MNTEFFISKKIISGKKGFSKPIVNIAILGIALGLAVMILTLAVVTGFQKEIREKVIGFGSHIQITNYNNNESFEGSAMDRRQPFLGELVNNPAIRHVQEFAIKAGILKTKKEIHGVVVKGVGKDFDWDFFNKNIVEGTSFASDTGLSGKALISKFHHQKLGININDSIVIFFIQNQKKLARKLQVCGIYETGLGDMFDQIYVLADIGHIQKLNGWDKNSVAGFEILLYDYGMLDAITEYVNEIIDYRFLARSIKEINRPVFSWLDSFDITAIIVISLTWLVAVINMISALLVLILERTRMIGILKSLGMSNWNVRKIFLYNGAYLIGWGMIWGNVIGISLCLLQRYFHLISLDPRTYYLSYVAINMDWWYVGLLNAGVFLLSIFALLLPSYVITYISPVKAMKFS